MNTERKLDRSVALDLDNTTLINPESSPTVRAGLPTLIKQLSQEEGYGFFITTSAERTYTIEALENAAIQDLFTDVFASEALNAGGWKRYSLVAKAAGFTTAQEIEAGMIVIGDSVTDSPVDVKNVVFINVGGGEGINGSIIGELLKTLREKGNGNFYQGFRALCGKGKELSYEEKQAFSPKKHILRSGATMQLGYNFIPEFDVFVPTITSIDASIATLATNRRR